MSAMASFPSLRLGASALALLALTSCSGTAEQAVPSSPASSAPPPRRIRPRARTKFLTSIAKFETATSGDAVCAAVSRLAA